MAELSGLSKRDLAERLLGLNERLGIQLGEMEELKAELRARAASGGFTELFPGRGKVAVSGGSKPTLKGIMPNIVPELFLASTAEEQEALKTSGLVVMTELWSKGSYPAVTVKVTPPLASPQ